MKNDRQPQETHSMSRRNFLKGTAIGTIGLAASGVLVGCTSKSESGTGPESSQTPASSNVPEWLGSEPQIADSDIAGTLETEVLVVGAGMAGMVAAVTAAEAGAKVMVLEKNPYIGPMHDYIGAVGTKQQAKAGVKVDELKLLNEIGRYSSFRCNQALVKVWIDHSAELIDWLGTIDHVNNSIDVVMEPDVHAEGQGTGGTDYYVPAIFHYVQTKDKTWINQQEVLQPYFEKLGGELKLEMPMIKLIKDGNKVVGAIVKNAKNKKYYKVLASKGIILCTGGYAGDSAMLNALNPEAVSMIASSDNLGTNTGDGIKAALWLGATKDPVATTMIFDRGHLKPGQENGYVLNDKGVLTPPTTGQFVFGSQPFLKVNSLGERFANESCPYDFIVHAASRYPKRSYCTVWDAKWKEDVRRFHTIGCSRLGMDPSESDVLNSFGWNTFELYEGTPDKPGVFAELQKKGELIVADSLEELAKGLKLPVDKFLATVKRHNELYDLGVDEDFGKEPYRLSKMDKAPYYGITMGGAILTTLDGLDINTDMQVLDENDVPIEGLYAAGDCSGGFFAGNYPEYLVGVALGRTLTFGRRAAKVVTKTL